MKTINDILDDFSLPQRMRYLEHLSVGSWDEAVALNSESEDETYWDLYEFTLK